MRWACYECGVPVPLDRTMCRRCRELAQYLLALQEIMAQTSDPVVYRIAREVVRDD